MSHLCAVATEAMAVQDWKAKAAELLGRWRQTELTNDAVAWMPNGTEEGAALHTWYILMLERIAQIFDPKTLQLNPRAETVATRSKKIVVTDFEGTGSSI